MAEHERPVGLTRDTGWQVGVRRTLPMMLDEAWARVTSPAGLRLWLGEGLEQALAPRLAYRLADGTVGAVTVFVPQSHLRLTWQPPGWARPSIIQVRTVPARGGVAIAFHQEHLPDAEAREARRARFSAAIDGLAL